MAGKKRCFVTVRALKRLDENLLCAVLGKFPEYLRTCGLVIPDSPDRDSLNYDAIRDACMGGAVPPELDDVLFFVSILGNKRGQDLIEREARYRRLRVDFGLDGVSCPDFAMRAWLQDWPKNHDLLEAAYARSRIFTSSRQGAAAGRIAGATPEWSRPGSKDHRSLAPWAVLGLIIE